MKNLFHALVFALISISLSGQSSSLPDLNKLSAYYEQAVKDWNVPSMVVGIVKDEKLIFSKGYGTKEVGTDRTPDEHTLYAIASNTKAFTSAIIATLVQEGKLGWNDKVKDYLPYFELYDTYVSQEVTIRDLLCHRVGLGTFSGDVLWYKSNLNSEEIIRRIKYLPQAYDFRAGYGYSNLMYVTAGELIKTVTGKSWSDNVRERILNPLSMERTATSSKELKSLTNYATPHAFTDEGTNLPIVWEDWEHIAAIGGLISSVHDMAKWVILNLNHGINGQDTILTSQSRNMLWTPHNNHMQDHTKPNDFGRHFNGYALGWGVSDYQGNLRVGHTGGYDGMLTAVNLIPDQNLGIIVLTNGMNSPMMAVTYYTLNAFLGAEEVDFSQKYLAARKKNKDTRIDTRKSARVPGTRPTLSMQNIVGTYQTPVYGNITVLNEEGSLKLNFEHTPALSASLEHWHYDTWKINWDVPHAWFSFGTIKFNADNNQRVTGISFDVPNDDFFFEEINAKKEK